MFHLTSTLVFQCGSHDVVVLTNEQHEPVVAQFLGLFRRVTEVSKQNDSNSRVDVSLPGWVSGDITEKSIYGPLAHLDDVVSNQTVCLSVHRLQGLSVGPLGETKHRPFVCIEPIRDVTDFVLLLNRKVECVRSGDVGSGRARRLVSIKEQGHAGKANSQGHSLRMPAEGRSPEPASYQIGRARANGHGGEAQVGQPRVVPGKLGSLCAGVTERPLRRNEQIDRPLRRGRTRFRPNSPDRSMVPAIPGRSRTSVRARPVKRSPSTPPTRPGPGTMRSGICSAGQPRRVCRGSDRGPP